MVKTASTKVTLSGAVMLFGAFTLTPILVDYATGGRIKDSGELLPTYGTYPVDILFLIFMISGMRLPYPTDVRRILWNG